MRKLIQQLAFLLLAGTFSLYISGCNGDGELDNTTQDEYILNFEVGGEQRSAIVVHPTNQEQPAPVLLFFHGNGGHAESTKNAILLHETWPEAVVVYGEGMQVNSSGEPTTDSSSNGWTLRFPYKYAQGQGQTKDISYIKKILDEVRGNHSIDTSRIFAAGHSSGSFFTLSLMDVYPEPFAGFAVVGAYSRYKVGTYDSNNTGIALQCVLHDAPYSGVCLPEVPTTTDNRCACIRQLDSDADRSNNPKPVLYVFGKTDTAFNTDGPDTLLGWNSNPSTNTRSKSTLQQLLFRNNIDPPEDDYWIDENRRIFFPTGSNGAEVQWQLYDGNHGWSIQTTNWVLDYFKSF